MKMHFNDNEAYSSTKFSGEQIDESEGEIFMIYDLKNESMVMLMESEDGKFSFAYDWRQARMLAEDFDKIESDSADDDVEEWENFEEIGTKTIAGVECRGYRSENEHSIMEYWVTRDEDLGIQKMGKLTPPPPSRRRPPRSQAAP